MAKTALKINYPDFEVESVIDPEFKKDLDKITHDHLTESNTARTIRNIRKNISATIKANYGITDKEQLTKITDGLLKIHGLHEDNFDFMKNFEDFRDSLIADLPGMFPENFAGAKITVLPMKKNSRESRIIKEKLWSCIGTWTSTIEILGLL